MTSASTRRISPKHVFLILHSYNRRRELLRLCRWAERKRLVHPLRLYRFRLQDEEIRLSDFKMRYPQSTGFAHCIHTLNSLLFGEPRIIRKGIGAYYRGRQTTLTTPGKGVRH
jgi:predicted metal-dependent HD superfamily phosphohydrolase